MRTRLIFVAPLLGSLVACGGVSQEQFDALAAQVKAMQGVAAQTGEQEGKSAALEQRIKNFETSTNETINKLGEILETLQRDQALRAERPAAPGSSGNNWDDADIILGIQEEGVVADGDNYKVRSAWLIRTAEAQAANAKGLKFSDGKDGGVMVRGIKAGSLLDGLGIKNGDLILEINGTAVASVAELSVALRKGDNPATVKLSRKKKELTLTYSVDK